MRSEEEVINKLIEKLTESRYLLKGMIHTIDLIETELKFLRLKKETGIS